MENEERNDRGEGYNRYYRGDGDGSYTGYQGGVGGGRQGDYTSSRRSKAMMMGDSGSGGGKSMMMKSGSGKFCYCHDMAKPLDSATWF